MKIAIISKRYIFQEAIVSMFQNSFEIEDIVLVKELEELSKENIDHVDMILLDTNNQESQTIDAVIKIKEANNHKKIIIKDASESISILTKSAQNDIDGYITDIEKEEEFIYIIKQILSNKPYYSSSSIKNIIKHMSYTQKEIDITKREKDIITGIINGHSNKKIGAELDITEYTVKKHISSILRKLNLKNRYEIEKYMLNKEGSGCRVKSYV